MKMPELPTETQEKPEREKPQGSAITVQELRSLVLSNRGSVMDILGEQGGNGDSNSSNGEKIGVMDWKRLLGVSMPSAECDFWGKCVKFWIRNRAVWNQDMRSMFNTYSEDMDDFRSTVRGILRTANRVWDGYLKEIFSDNAEIRQKYVMSSEIEQCRDLLSLICYSVYGRTDTKEGFPKKSQKHRRKLRWEARRKIALALLVRFGQQDPEYAYRMQNSSHFEDVVLRDRSSQKHSLISPQEVYERVRMKFFISEAGVVNILSLDSLDHPSLPKGDLTGMHEYIDLYRFKITGRTAPFEERVELTVYALPGDKYEMDVRDNCQDIPEVRAMEMKVRRTIMDYKPLYAIALKRLRGREIRDGIRCTFVVETPEDEVLLKKILDTELGSTVNRRDFGKGGNSSSAKAYQAVHIIEAIHHEKEKRNYQVEVRVSQLKDLLRDRSSKDEVGHNAYRRRRSVRIYRTLIPREYYPEIEDDIIRTEMPKGNHEQPLQA